MADLGYILLCLALVASIYSAVAYIFGARGRNPTLIKSAKSSLLATCGLVSLAVIVLLSALLTHNFQFQYVVDYSRTDTSIPYLISALWAGNDGSLLFWAWLLSVFATIVVLKRYNSGKELVPFASSVIMFSVTFFLILVVFTSSPFTKTLYVPAEVIGLNPLLENLGMIVHPPLLLAGYVGLTIPFAFAIAALFSRRLNNDWLPIARIWTLVSWLLLGVGNIIGAWWAYVELGWGGYWAWDPVENAGLMPWLVATAFLHSIMIQRRRGMNKVWNMVLIILAFNLTIFGTYLTRSDFLDSVHTFPDLTLDPYFLIFLAITFLGSLVLVYYRQKELRSEAEVEHLVSREGAFLLNSLLLVGSTFAIFIGTVSPKVFQVLRGAEISIGESFFNRVNAPIFLAVVLLAGICTLLGWRRAPIQNLLRKFLWPLVAAIVVGIVIIILGIREWYAVIAFSLCSFVLSSVLFEWLRETNARHRATGDNYFKAFWHLLRSNRPRYGGYIVHISIALMTIGVIGSSFYDVEIESTLKPGESMTIGNYSLTYESIGYDETPSKVVVYATLFAYKDDKLIGQMTPQKYFHEVYENPVTEVAIHSTLLEDLYVILAGWDEDGSASFEVRVNPLVIWIWIGGGIFVIGGLVAFWPERRKPQLKPVTQKAERAKTVADEIEQRVQQLRQEKGGFCPQCGTRRPEDARFCPNCGASLG